MSAPETFVPNLTAAWRADTRSGSDLTDLSGNGNTLLSTGVTYGTTNVLNGWGIGGVAVAELNGFSAYYSTASATPWAFLHDGSGATTWAIFSATHTGIKVLFDTGAFSPGNNGAYVWIDGDLGRVGIDFTKNLGNGTSDFPADSGRIIDYIAGARFSWQKTFAMNVPHVLVVTIGASDSPDIQVWLDGHLIDSLSIGDREKGPSTLVAVTHEAAPRNFNSGAAGFPMRVAAAAHSAITLLAGELAEIGFCSSVLSASDRQAVEDWAASHYGVSLDRTRQGQLIWTGNSLVDNVWHPFPIYQQFPELVTPKLRRKQRNVMRAVAGLESNQMITKAPKHVTPMYDATLPFNILVAWEGVNDIADGATKEATLATQISYCQARQAEGWKVVAAVPPPHRLVDKTTFEWLRDQFRALWPTFADALADITVDPIVGDWDAMTSDWGGGSGLKTYRVDGIHFTIAGNTIVEPYFTEAINSLMRGRLIVKKR